MTMNKDIFKIIEFDGRNEADTPYFPEYFESSGIWKDLIQEDFFRSILDTKVPLGKSRYGGSIIDFPKSMIDKQDKKLCYMGQMNLSEFTKYDREEILPKKGHLLFFHNFQKDEGKVMFFEGDSSELERSYINTSQYDSQPLHILSKIRSSKESWKENYIKLEKYDLECYQCDAKNFLHCSCPDNEDLPYRREEVQDGKYVWDSFAMVHKSKIFGIYTDVQYSETEIEEITYGNDILLFQIGENINSEGIFSVLIDRDELKNKNFGACRTRWSQS